MSDQQSYAGQRFGNYRAEHYLSRGAFAYVYSACHLFYPRVVAIKVPRDAHHNTIEVRKQFYQEAQILNELRSPYILDLLDFGATPDGILYLITAFADRGSLRNLLNREQPYLLPPKLALRILTQVGAALEYTHARGFLHHDVKPENILITENWTALLADFGAAARIPPRFTRQAHARIGTGPYVAPEQFKDEISPESEQYSLGCIAYELFAGRTPFNAPTIEILRDKHLYQQPVPPSCFNPTIPRHVEEAILKALAKRRINRFGSVHDFVAALQGR